MSNGFTVERMLEMVLERLGRMEENQQHTLDQIQSINTNGCAHRATDVERIASLERWRDKGIVGIIATLIVSMGSLIAMLYDHIVPGK